MEDKKVKPLEKALSRRKFLCDAGKFAVGTAVGIGSIGLVGCSAKMAEQTKEKAKETVAATNTKVEFPPTPWPYKKLDPEVVRKAGFEAYKRDLHCMAGSFAAIIETLAKEVGYPYDAIPPVEQLAYYGAGGVMGWATLCGAANGSCMAINLILGKDHEKLGVAINELLGYYSTTPLPTANSNKFGDMGEQAQSVAGNPLCHVSVTNWCKASGKKSFSPERAERCAKLAGDIAAKAVELLNQIIVEGSFTPVYKAPEAITDCGSCHTKGGVLENSRGKMDCLTCHDDHRG
ncbi:C-GCAxxG-C-C family protein [Calderihabitans maritimus]|nr:C-GCAxxG-C-C family protein [Calderihabitans maritimus]